MPLLLCWCALFPVLAKGSFPNRIEYNLLKLPKEGFGAPVATFADWRSEGSRCQDGTFENLRTFVNFIGYPRSGHTLVAMLLDAHPEIVISNEVNVIKRWSSWPSNLEMLYHILRKNQRRFGAVSVAQQQVDQSEKADSRSPTNTKSPVSDAAKEHFNYRVPGAWQGRTTCLRVIGDKSGSSTSNALRRNWNATIVKFDAIRHSGVDVRLIHVLRNPFDLVATAIARRDLGVRAHAANATLKVIASEWNKSWNRKVDKFLEAFELHDEFSKSARQRVLVVHGADLIHDARREVQRWCAFLDLECPQRYATAVSRVVYTQVYKSRLQLVWPASVVKRIELFCRHHRDLMRYNFTSD